jgi:hypothetical protein
MVGSGEPSKEKGRASFLCSDAGAPGRWLQRHRDENGSARMRPARLPIAKKTQSSR